MEGFRTQSARASLDDKPHKREKVCQYIGDTLIPKGC